MFNVLTGWIEKRRAIRRRWQADAGALLRKDELDAYYAAQRLAARSRLRGDRAEFWHWAKVAAEVARLSSVAEMDASVLANIVSEESRRSRADGEQGRSA